MYTTNRCYYRYGNKDGYVDVTTKEFDTLKKAINYAERYATGTRFVSVNVRDSDGNVIYEILQDGRIFSNGCRLVPTP